jgi:MFS family permease
MTEGKGVKTTEEKVFKKNFFGLGRNVFVAGLVSFFMDVSSEMLYPLIPLFLSGVLGVNKSVIGLIEGIAESTASLLKIFSGYISDRIGNRKWLMFGGYAISTLSRPGMALAASWHHVLGARFVDRFGKGVRTAPRDALIAEATEKSFLARAFSVHRSMDTMGAVVGPAIAFFLLGIFSNDYRKIFWLSMIPGAIAVFLIAFFIRESKKPAPQNFQKPRLTLKHFDWRFKGFVLISTVFAFGNSSDAFLILRAEQSGIPVVMIPVVYLLFNLIYSISAIPAGIAADRFGKKRVILMGMALFSLLYYGFATATDTRAIWVLFCLYGFFMGLTEGIFKAFLTTLIPPDFKGTGFGVYNTAVGLAALPASIAGGWLWDRYSSSATFYFGALTAAAATAMFIAYIIADRNLAKPPTGS